MSSARHARATHIWRNAHGRDAHCRDAHVRDAALKRWTSFRSRPPAWAWRCASWSTRGAPAAPGWAAPRPPSAPCCSTSRSASARRPGQTCLQKQVVELTLFIIFLIIEETTQKHRYLRCNEYTALFSWTFGSCRIRMCPDAHVSPSDYYGLLA